MTPKIIYLKLPFLVLSNKLPIKKYMKINKFLIKSNAIKTMEKL